jgi:hypothetical protein
LLASLGASALALGNLVPMIALPAGLLFSTVFYASLYFSFVDCFLFTKKDDTDTADAPPSELPPPDSPPID